MILFLNKTPGKQPHEMWVQMCGEFWCVGLFKVSFFCFSLIKYLVQLFTWFVNAKIEASGNLRVIWKNFCFHSAVDWISALETCLCQAGCRDQAYQSHVKGKEKLGFLYNLLFNDIAAIKLPSVLKFHSSHYLKVLHGCRCHGNSQLALNNNKILTSIGFVF